MALEGEYDRNRFYFNAINKKHIDNETSDPFNHYISLGGYAKDVGNNIFVGGFKPFTALPKHQSIRDEISNNPYPVVNALVDSRLIVGVNALVDKPLPPRSFSNPLVR
jgi:hypothetical protein